MKNCLPELSYLPADLFNICLKESYFQVVGRSHWWSLYLKMLGKCLQPRLYLRFECKCLFWEPGDNLSHKCPSNSCKRVAFAAGVQGKPKCHRAFNLNHIISQSETFFLLNFYLTDTLCRHQSLNYCDGNILFLWQRVQIQTLKKIFVSNTLLQLFTTLRIITASTTVVPFCLQG